jgi:hypothetical protein
MENMHLCPECGAEWQAGKTCQEAFHQMLFWESENPSYGEVHHLMVLCYHLQHPSLYSPEGLAGSKQLLEDFLERGLSPAQARAHNRVKLDSGNRTWKIKGAPGSQGAYEHPIRWTLTAGAVVAGGIEAYCDSVRAWARSVLADLKSSGN